MEEKPLSIGGKSYISSKRAADIFEYTTDYIGQLSRAKKINSIMVGRDRFIDYSSIAAYVENQMSQTLSSERNFVHKLAEPVYQSIDRPSIISDASPRRDSVSRPLFAIEKLVGGLALIGLLLFFTTQPIGVNGVKQLSNFVVGVEGSNQIASSFTPIVDLGYRADIVYLGFLDKINIKIISLWNWSRNRALSWLPDPIKTSENTTSVVVNEPADVASYPGSLTPDEVRSITREVVDQELAKTIDYASQTAQSNVGVVASPSTGSTSGDEILKQKIRASFSDQVSITIDEGSGSGIVRPIFRNPRDDKYVFVLVPIKQ